MAQNAILNTVILSVITYFKEHTLLNIHALWKLIKALICHTLY